jgi:hypothetical protein
MTFMIYATHTGIVAQVIHNQSTVHQQPTAFNSFLTKLKTTGYSGMEKVTSKHEQLPSAHNISVEGVQNTLVGKLQGIVQH